MSTLTLCTLGSIIACLMLDQQEYRRSTNRVTKNSAGFYTGLVSSCSTNAEDHSVTISAESSDS